MSFQGEFLKKEKIMMVAEAAAVKKIVREKENGGGKRKNARSRELSQGRKYELFFIYVVASFTSHLPHNESCVCRKESIPKARRESEEKMVFYHQPTLEMNLHHLTIHFTIPLSPPILIAQRSELSSTNIYTCIFSITKNIRAQKGM